jgi:hypothetical protein
MSLLPFIATAWAATIVAKPGCYRFQGRIVELDDSRLVLRIHDTSADAEMLTMALTGKRTILIKGSRVELVASVKSPGKLSGAEISLDRKDLKLVPTGATGPDLTGGWVGPSCP